jgi:hypothetical protein
MSLPRHLRIAATCLVALALAGVVSACGKTEHPGEPVREGLSTPLGGLRYTVFITRQLNLKNEEDQGYYRGAEPAPGHALYAVFLQACNEGTKDAVASRTFEIHDTQGSVFQPKPSDAANPFMWHGGPVPAENCEPRRGSLAQLGPASGAIVLFDLPIGATENRPLELHIKGPVNAETGKNDQAIIELDV